MSEWFLHASLCKYKAALFSLCFSVLGIETVALGDSISPAASTRAQSQSGPVNQFSWISHTQPSNKNWSCGLVWSDFNSELCEKSETSLYLILISSKLQLISYYRLFVFSLSELEHRTFQLCPPTKSYQRRFPHWHYVTLQTDTRLWSDCRQVGFPS